VQGFTRVQLEVLLNAAGWFLHLHTYADTKRAEILREMVVIETMLNEQHKMYS